jgi:hypothetical protein
MKYHRKAKRGKEKVAAPGLTGIDNKKREDRFDHRVKAFEEEAREEGVAFAQSQIHNVSGY